MSKLRGEVKVVGLFDEGDRIGGESLNGYHGVVLFCTPDECAAFAKHIYQVVEMAPVRKQGMCDFTEEQLVAACANVGVDLTCGACAAIFYTGTAVSGDEHTCKGPQPMPRRMVTPGGVVCELPRTEAEKGGAP